METETPPATLEEFYAEATNLTKEDLTEMEQNPATKQVYKELVGALQFGLWAKKHELCTVEDCVANQVDECVRLDWILEKVKEKFETA